jgi:hypothetical protein
LTQSKKFVDFCRGKRKFIENHDSKKAHDSSIFTNSGRGDRKSKESSYISKKSECFVLDTLVECDQR